MIPKGTSDVRGLRSLNTRPGPVTESGALRGLYLLACEKANLEKRRKLGERQVRQASKRLLEVKMQMMKLESVSGKFRRDDLREAASVANPKSRAKHASLGY